MKVIATENFEKPDELIDVTIEIGDQSVCFTYPLCMINVAENGDVTLELGIDEIQYLD